MKNQYGTRISETDFLNISLENVYIIDVRHSFELGSGALEIAHHVPYTDLLAHNISLPKDKIILTYCNYGNRAGRAADFLAQKGYKAFSLGGYALFSQNLQNYCKK